MPTRSIVARKTKMEIGRTTDRQKTQKGRHTHSASPSQPRSLSLSSSRGYQLLIPVTTTSNACQIKHLALQHKCPRAGVISWRGLGPSLSHKDKQQKSTIILDLFDRLVCFHSHVAGTDRRSVVRRARKLSRVQEESGITCSIDLTQNDRRECRSHS